MFNVIIGQFQSKIFKDRDDAGRELAKVLKLFQNEKPVVLALPRGGVPVAEKVAQELSAPLSVVVSRKIGHPSNPEFGIGAIAEGETIILNDLTMAEMGLDRQEVVKVIESEKAELNRRLRLYLEAAGRPDLKSRTVIVVDDGLATGMTARAAIEAIKKHSPKKIIYAAPVCAKDSAKRLKGLVDEVICVLKPDNLRAIGQFYRRFEAVSDDLVINLLHQAKVNRAS